MRWNPTVGQAGTVDRAGTSGSSATTNPATTPAVTCDVHGRVSTVTINRPHKRNALNLATFRSLNAALSRLATDATVRAVIVTGAGDRAFSAGADVGDLEDLTGPAAYEFSASGQYVFDQIENMPQPVIAAINGVAFGGGLELALACDIRIASDVARFGQPEILLANTPGWGGTQRLMRVVGVGRAKAMMLTGQPIDSATALAYGLVTDVVPAAELYGRADALGARLATMAPPAVHAIKQAVSAGLTGGMDAGLRAERAGVAACCGTPEQVAAVGDFLLRRTRRG